MYNTVIMVHGYYNNYNDSDILDGLSKIMIRKRGGRHLATTFN